MEIDGKILNKSSLRCSSSPKQQLVHFFRQTKKQKIPLLDSLTAHEIVNLEKTNQLEPEFRKEMTEKKKKNCNKD